MLISDLSVGFSTMIEQQENCYLQIQCCFVIIFLFCVLDYKVLFFTTHLSSYSVSELGSIIFVKCHIVFAHLKERKTC